MATINPQSVFLTQPNYYHLGPSPSEIDVPILVIDGTGGNSYVQMNQQTAAPTTPIANAFKWFSNITGEPAWIQSDGFTRTFNAAVTANRTGSRTLPRTSSTATSTEVLQNKTIMGGVDGNVVTASGISGVTVRVVGRW